MSIVSYLYAFVVGVDTHARNHVYSIITTTGHRVDDREFPTTAKGLSRALDWVARRTGGDLSTLWVIEGIGTYGALLADQVTEAGYRVVEAARMSAKDRNGVGKNDHIDAHRIAATVLPLDETELRSPRDSHGTRRALQILVKARDSMTKDRTRTVNALTAVLRSHDLGIDARRSLSRAKVAVIAKWRSRTEPVEVLEARREAVRLARRVRELDAEITDYAKRIRDLVAQSPARRLLAEPGIGPITAAVFFLAWSHPGRIHSEAGFAKLAGANPIPASSGNTVRFRLNRGGDRRLNSALYMVIITRLSHDDHTRKYLRTRMSENKTKKEVIRSLKRYLARRVYRILESGDRKSVV